MNPVQKIKLKYSILFPALLLGMMWASWLIVDASGMDASRFGTLPRSFQGLIGILTGPFIHDPENLDHILSNSLPMLVLGAFTYYFYRRVAIRVFLWIYLAHGLLLWCFARPVVHIGASGLIYGLATFLFASGIFRRDRSSVAVALVVTFLYGGMMWGIFPMPNHVSWEAHLFGAVSGVMTAAMYWKVDLPPPPVYDYEVEEEEPETDEEAHAQDNHDGHHPPKPGITVHVHYLPKTHHPHRPHDAL